MGEKRYFILEVNSNFDLHIFIAWLSRVVENVSCALFTLLFFQNRIFFIDICLCFSVLFFLLLLGFAILWNIYARTWYDPGKQNVNKKILSAGLKNSYKILKNISKRIILQNFYKFLIGLFKFFNQ